MSILAVVLVLAFSLAAYGGDDSAWERVPSMIKPLSTKIEADFILRRHFKDMDYDMNGNGSMSFIPGKELVFRTEKPMKAVCTLTAEQIELNDIEAKRITTIKAEKQAWIAKIFKLQDGWLKGDLSGLKTDFNVEIQDGSTLLFTPKAAATNAFFKSVQLQINPKTRFIDKIVLNEAAGDSIEITFINIRE